MDELDVSDSHGVQENLSARTRKMEAGRLAIWMQVTAAVDVIWNKELAKAQEQDVLPG